ncbi:MAG TPA: hypothetical protein VF548_14115 [Allosphingosinicella sp.]|jgi:hypothetical protein
MRPVIRLLKEKLGPSMVASEIRDLQLESADEYCLICESPLGNKPLVTHRVRISENGYVGFPTCEKDAQGKPIVNSSGRLRCDNSVRAADWVNSILCCEACFDAQSGPDWIDGLRVIAETSECLSLIGANLGPGRLDEGRSAAIFQAAAKTWIWPDSAEDGSARGLIPFEGDDTWNLLSYRRATSSQVQLRDQGLVRLSDEEAEQPWAKEPETKVWIEPSAGLSDADNMRVKNTIRGFNLNRYRRADGKDLRVESRTAADAHADQWRRVFEELPGKWQGGVDSFSEWLMLYSADAQPNVIPPIGDLRAALRQIGFWTIWARTFLDLGNKWLAAKVHPWAVEAFLTALLVQYEAEAAAEDEVMAAGAGASKADEGASADGLGPREDFDPADEDEASFFPMVLKGTDVARLPQALGGPL